MEASPIAEMGSTRLPGDKKNSATPCQNRSYEMEVSKMSNGLSNNLGPNYTITADNIYEVEVPMEFIRAYLDAEIELDQHEEFATALDLAQGEVFQGKSCAYLIIRIAKEEDLNK